MFVFRRSWLLAATLVVFTDLPLHGERPDASQDTPAEWTRWNFPDAAAGYEAAKGESFCSTLEAARADARSTARSALVWALTNDPSKWTEPDDPRRDQIIKALDPLFEDMRDYMVTERDGVFHGYALVRVRTDPAKAAITHVPASVRRPAVSWLGQSTYAHSARSTLEIRGPRSETGSFTFHFVGEPSGSEILWYFEGWTDV